MPLAREKAKNVWLLSFGDLVTLLITFFIMMLVLNKGEISHLQKWSETQLDHVASQLQSDLAMGQEPATAENAQVAFGTVSQTSQVSVSRTPLGVVIDIQSDEAFIKGGFEPSEQLKAILTRLGDQLKTLTFIAVDDGGMPQDIAELARKGHVTFKREISIAGYTDNDPINPESRLRNNWFLSAMRAQSVLQTLFQVSGLPADLFSVAGYGEFRPRVPNTDSENKALNRRIQIVISATFEQDVEEKNSVTQAS